MSNRPIRFSPRLSPPRLCAECTAWHCARHSRRGIADDRRIPTALIEQIASLVAPPRCAACGSASPAGAVVCVLCERGLARAPRAIEPGPPGVDLAVAASPFEGTARRIVHGLKYARRL